RRDSEEKSARPSFAKRGERKNNQQSRPSKKPYKKNDSSSGRNKSTSKPSINLDSAYNGSKL
ncbi:hypothetical protein OAC06_05760, partial [Alphaproteobacteria bacterium]|nr:hypothetical protein [Alphaproteobacteria bacterium]